MDGQRKKWLGLGYLGDRSVLCNLGQFLGSSLWSYAPNRIQQYFKKDCIVAMSSYQFKQYFMNQLIVFDIASNSLIGGSPYETLSTRIGRIIIRHGMEVFRERHPALSVVQKFLNWLEPRHCQIEAIKAQNRKPGHRQIWGE